MSNRITLTILKKINKLQWIFNSTMISEVWPNHPEHYIENWNATIFNLLTFFAGLDDHNQNKFVEYIETLKL